MAYSRRALAYNIGASYNKYITVSATRGYRTQNLLIYKAVLRPVGPPAGLKDFALMYALIYTSILASSTDLHYESPNFIEIHRQTLSYI